ncbi:MAG: CoA transferase, partial [Inquilinus sp.]|nr:CoA transferase [Inquilinus sp.]
MLDPKPLDFLEGIRVLDIGQYLPGPYAAQILADLGAEVIKVEPPSGDPMRRMAPLDDNGVSLDYGAVNAGKTVITIDLKSEAGRDAFAGLLGGADVLIESFRPDVLDRLEFTRERIEALNPALIHVSLSGWGQTGPYRDRAGHDINYMALGGGLNASGPQSHVV